MILSSGLFSDRPGFEFWPWATRQDTLIGVNNNKIIFHNLGSLNESKQIEKQSQEYCQTPESILHGLTLYALSNLVSFLLPVANIY